MSQNLMEVRAGFGHRFRSGLAKADAMSLARSFQSEPIMLQLRDEVIAGDRRPSEATNRLEACGFVGDAQRGGLAAGDPA